MAHKSSLPPPVIFERCVFVYCQCHWCEVLDQQLLYSLHNPPFPSTSQPHNLPSSAYTPKKAFQLQVFWNRPPQQKHPISIIPESHSQSFYYPYSCHPYPSSPFHPKMCYIEAFYYIHCGHLDAPFWACIDLDYGHLRPRSVLHSYHRLSRLL